MHELTLSHLLLTQFPSSDSASAAGPTSRDSCCSACCLLLLCPRLIAARHRHSEHAPVKPTSAAKEKGIRQVSSQAVRTSSSIGVQREQNSLPHAMMRNMLLPYT